jgi:hypothetical protein
LPSRSSLSSPERTDPQGLTRSSIQSVALLVVLVFLVVGILGFISGITTNYDELKFAGHNSDAQLLGIPAV